MMFQINSGAARLVMVMLALTPTFVGAQGTSHDHAAVAQSEQPRRDAVTVADIGAPETWGAASNVVKIKHLYFSEQPDAATLAEARARGVGVVINLRERSEQDWDEEAAVTQAGLTYYNIPIPSTGTSFDDAAMKKISELARKHSDQGILLHCSSGNRASAWLAIHLAKDHGMNSETSISLAKQAGLTKSEMETRVREYLHEGKQSPMQ